MCYLGSKGAIKWYLLQYEINIRAKAHLCQSIYRITIQKD